MKILFESHVPLPVQKYGGTERIIYWLMKELVQMGHEVYLIGDPKSRVNSIGVQLIPSNGGDWRPLIPKDIDLIHLFYAPPFFLNRPYLVTIEGNGKPGESFPKNTVFVSRKHAEIHGADHFVYNGIDLEEYPFPEEKENLVIGESQWEHFLFMAKASWKVKNLDHCLKACKEIGKHLHVAGGRVWNLSRKIHSYGMVAQPDKAALLREMDAFLWPVRWHEPFGIGIIEAMAYGLPVIGSTYGSLRELIQPEVGVLCENYGDLVEALRKPPRPFETRKIREYVELHYSSKVMALNYVNYYQRVLKGDLLHQKAPSMGLSQDPEILLPF